MFNIIFIHVNPLLFGEIIFFFEVCGAWVEGGVLSSYAEPSP